MKKTNAFSLDRRKMHWRFLPGAGDAGLRNARCTITVNDARLDWADADHIKVSERPGTCAVRLDFEDPALSWEMRFKRSHNGERLTIESTVVNTGDETAILGPIDLISIDPASAGRVVLGGKPTQFTVFKQQMWNTRVQSLMSDNGAHASQFIGHLYSPAATRVLSANFVTIDRMIGTHHFNYDTRSKSLAYRACCQLRGHGLAPGAKLKSETLLVRAYDDPHEPLEDWAKTLQRRYKPALNPKTTVGWLGWSWVDCLSEREGTPEAVTLGNARAIRERLPGFDFDYIWISQTNLHAMTPGNWLSFNKQHYPRGFEKLVAELKGLGIKLGLWIAPFWGFEGSEAFKANPDSLIRGRDGHLMTAETKWEFIQSERARRDTFTLAKLDGSHPAAIEYIAKVFTTYRKLGIRYYMLDFLGSPAGPKRAVWDQNMTASEADRALMLAIREAAGPDTHLLTAVGSTPCYVGATDAARVSTDYGEGRPLYPPFHCLFNATYVVHDKHFGFAPKFLQNAASTYFMHRRLWINDFNVMTIDKPVPRNIAEITTTVFGLSGSPIMIGDDMRTIAEERLRLVKLCLPRTEEMARPVDLFEHVQPDDYARILMLPVRTAWDSYTLLAVFNLGDVSERTTLEMSSLGLSAKGRYAVYDFWNEEYAGDITGTLSAEVPPSSCKLYRIAKARRHPWLLSTDMHIQQGLVEVPELKWDAKRLELSGTVTRPKGESGSLFFLMPDGFRLVNHEGHKLMKDGRDNVVIIRRDFEFKSGKPLAFKLRFERMRKGLSGYY